jgi:hypothetical protein
MKKILTGCLIVVVIAIIGVGAAGYYAYRAVRPVIDNASNYMEKAREVTRLGENIEIKTPFEPPAGGELTQQQVERFIAVQTRVRSDMSDKWTQIEQKSKEMREKVADRNNKDWSITEFTQVFSEIANIWVDARKSQVKALNVQKFSEAEYEWVRKRVYEAAGVELAGSVDLSRIESLAGRGGVAMPSVELPKVPEKNIALVKPHVAKIKEWIPMAALGL